MLCLLHLQEGLGVSGRELHGKSSLALQAERLISKISLAPPSTPFLAQDATLRAGSLQIIHSSYTHNFASSRDAAWPGLGIFGRGLSCASKNWPQWEYFSWTTVPSVSMYPGCVLSGFFAHEDHVHQAAMASQDFYCC